VGRTLFPFIWRGTSRRPPGFKKNHSVQAVPFFSSRFLGFENNHSRELLPASSAISDLPFGTHRIVISIAFEWTDMHIMPEDSIQDSGDLLCCCLP
jgi:hypothetical protein